MNCIITGTNRGIGLELTRQALDKTDRVLAIARHSSPELTELKKVAREKLEIVSLDLSHPEAPSQVAAAVENWPSVELFINNAGVYLDDDRIENFVESFRINSVLPVFLSRALYPKLKQAKAPKAIYITSLMGSIEDNSSGGAYAYRASKAALNMLVKCIAIEQPWLVAATVHPGWVQTDMGGKNAPTTVRESASGIWSVMESLNQKKSGSFFDFTGEALPW